MKKLINFLILILLSTLLNAQIEKGKFIIGMSTTLSSIGTGPEMFGVGFSSSKTIIGNNESDPIRNFGVNLVPRMGYFITENIVVGVDINFAYNSKEIKNSNESQSSIYGGLGAYCRYSRLIGSVYPFLEVDTGFGFGSVNIDSDFYGDSDYNSNFYNIGGGLGIAIPIGSIVMLDLMVDYDYIKELSDQLYYGQEIESVIHSFGFELGLMVTIGNK
ncbi:MAG: hypothetical protein A2W99_03925 [Bacteroidetes bacterium GWF2_33_16]|nr:MAG: hypothetical protein A2X00_07140 [Bacteroidetes bacterium GWE2_32_14]OFY02940.1 MAG: hypothetical protein A2W99_03925 [Bacteroidetes bacterium GWF2_33_16]